MLTLRTGMGQLKYIQQSHLSVINYDYIKLNPNNALQLAGIRIFISSTTKWLMTICTNMWSWIFVCEWICESVSGIITYKLGTLIRSAPMYIFWICMIPRDIKFASSVCWLTTTLWRKFLFEHPTLSLINVQLKGDNSENYKLHTTYGVLVKAVVCTFVTYKLDTITRGKKARLQYKKLSYRRQTAPHICANAMALLTSQKHAPLHMCYQAKFGHSALKM